jgi:3-oxoacyl-[acyl-carrier protein] reductase
MALQQRRPREVRSVAAVDRGTPAEARPSPSPSEGRLAGRRAVVTGGARGIGAEIATTFAAHGAAVAIVDVLADEAAATASAIGGSSVVADLRDPTACRAAVEQAVGELGGIDILVNNAGVLRLSSVLDMSVDEWDLVFEVNVRPMLVTTQVAAKAMIHQGTGGRIVNMASMAAKAPEAGQAHYSASKAAVVAFTSACAVELGPHGITVNAICPGYVLTEMGRATRTDEMVEAWSARSPLGRCATEADVASMALFCASEDAAYCTGQAFNVSGGMVTH